MKKAGKRGAKQKLRNAICAFMCAASSCFFSSVIAADIEIPGQILVISKDKWNDRQLNVEGIGESDMLIYGGEEQGNITNVAIDGSSNYISAYGGYYDGINEKNPEPITGNVVEIASGGAGWIVYDDPKKVNNRYNRLHLYDTSGYGFAVNTIAGHAGLGEASGNVINLRGGLMNGYVIAAESKTATKDTASYRLRDNTVNLFNETNLSWASVYGAALFDDDTRGRTPFMGTNNTFNVYIKDADINELNAFNNYNFYLPTTIRPNDLAVNVNGEMETNINGAKVIGIFPSSVMFQVNDRLTLLQNYAGIPDNNATFYQGVHSETGLTRGYNASAEYDLIVEKSDEEHVILRLQGIKTTPVTKTIAQSRVPTLINRGGDFLPGGATDAAITATNFPSSASSAADAATAGGSQIFTPFFAATASSMRHTTGSHVDMHGYSMVIGMSRKIETPTRIMLIAPVIEYGRGNYDACMDNGARGKGTNRYYGLGIVFRNTMKNGVFYEGSLRGGRIKTDYASYDFSYNGYPLYEDFESSSRYIGAHIGLGREISLCERDNLMYYGRFFYTHTGSDTIRLTTGDFYHLSAVDSKRLRLGFRYTHKADEKNKLYAGFAVEHEFDGSSYAVYEGLRTDTPTIKGNSAMLELGWVIKPMGNDRLSFDLSGSGWVGRQRGVTGRFGVNWMF